MGGHRAGEVAAAEAVTVLSNIIKEMDIPSFTFEEAHGVLQLAIERTNSIVYENEKSMLLKQTAIYSAFLKKKKEK